MYQRSLRPDELMHHGILGMKWGVRRYQNPDGSLTSVGKKRIGNGDTFESKKNRVESDSDIDKATSTKKRTTKTLNYLEKQRAKSQANANTFEKKAGKAREKANVKKYLEYRSKGESYLKNVKDIEALKWKVVDSALSKGQSPQITKKYNKYVSSGRNTANRILSSIAFGAPGLVAATAHQRIRDKERYIERNRWTTVDKYNEQYDPEEYVKRR